MSDKKNALVPQQGGALAAYDYGDQAGAGFENQTQDDVSIPFLGLLQALSPEVAGEPSKRIKGASAGMLINTVTKELFDGSKGVIIQPCSTRQVYIEWKPRKQGGGYVATHQVDSDVVKKCKAEQQFGKYAVNGNDLIDTFYLACLLHRHVDIAAQAQELPEPFLIAFTSTKIKSYRAIMTRLRTVKGNPPLFAHRLSLSTLTETNSEGTFSNFVIAPLIENDVLKSMIPPTAEGASQLLNAGSALHVAYNAGTVDGKPEQSAAGGVGGNDKPAF